MLIGGPLSPPMSTFSLCINPFSLTLTMLTENCVSLSSVQEFIETEAWLLLTFLLCLQNKLISTTFYCHVLKSADI